jgi:voltage-gated potassium channel
MTTVTAPERDTPISSLPPGISPSTTTRQAVYRLLHELDGHSTATRFIRQGLELLIVANVIVVILETVQDLHTRFETAFLVIDIVSVAVFSVEYALRIWSIVESDDPRYQGAIRGRLRWMRTPMAIADIVAILPFLIHVLPVDDMRIVRALRLLRLERLVLLGRYSKSLDMLRTAIRHSRQELAASLGIIGLVLVIAASMMYFVEHNVQPQHFSSIPATLWWAVITLTSVGYGDVFPITPLGKLIGGVIAMLGIFVVAIPSGIITTALWEQRAKTCTCPHCGREHEL